MERGPETKEPGGLTTELCVTPSVCCSRSYPQGSCLSQQLSVLQMSPGSRMFFSEARQVPVSQTSPHSLLAHPSDGSRTSVKVIFANGKDSAGIYEVNSSLSVPFGLSIITCKM